MSNNKLKIELELDQEVMKKIEIMSKSFGIDPEQFIKIALNHEIHYISSNLDSKDPQDIFETYYKREINMSELKKLIEVI